jgi:hypothetical protein
MTLSATKKDKRETADLEALSRFEDIYKTQANTISRRLLGAKVPADTRLVAYLTDSEMEAVKGLAESIGVNCSTLVRLTMIELAAAFHSPNPDPRMS